MLARLSLSCGLLASFALGQAPIEPAGGKFDVVSITPCEPGGIARVGDQITRGGTAAPTVSPGRVRWNCASVKSLSMGMMSGPMLRALLEDRFKLKVHFETKQVPVYELTVAKGGAKLTAFNGKCTPIDFTKGMQMAEGMCHVGGRAGNPNNRFDAQGISLDDFATGLTAADRPVINETGISGLFDFHVVYASESNISAPDAAHRSVVRSRSSLG